MSVRKKNTKEEEKALELNAQKKQLKSNLKLKKNNLDLSEPKLGEPDLDELFFYFFNFFG